MLNQSRNLTMQEIDFTQQSHHQTIDDISSIHYEDAYNYLQDFSFNGDHLQIYNLTLSPARQNYQIRMYDQPQQIEDNQSELRGFGNLKENINICKKQKIVTLFIKDVNNKAKQAIKLPITTKPIELQVQTKQQGIMTGYIMTNNINNDSILVNSQGKQFGTLSYCINSYRPSQHKIVSEEVELGGKRNTLYENQFIDTNQKYKQESDISFMRRSRSHDDTLKDSSQLLISRFTTLKSSAIVQHQINIKQKNQSELERKSLNRRFKKQDKQDSQLLFQQNQKDYRGENTDEMAVQQRISIYKTPLPYNSTKEKNQQIDYQSLQRSKQELGLSNINIEEMISPKHHKTFTSSESPSYMPVSTQSQPSILPSTFMNKLIIKQLQNSQINKDKLIDFGMGTYTPIPSRQSVSKKSNNSQTKTKQRQFSQPKKIPLSRKHSHQSSNGQQTSNLKDSNFIIQEESIQNELPINRINRTHQQLSVKSHVLDIKVDKLNQSIVSKKDIATRRRDQKGDWQSCQQKPSKKLISEIQQSDFSDVKQFDLVISNLSVNFRKNTFGSKWVDLQVGKCKYRAQPLNGNNLIWIGKGYLFKKINLSQDIILTVSGETSDGTVNYGRVRINLSQLLANIKQNCYQTLLINQTQVIAIVVLGYQVLKKYVIYKQIFPKTKKSHSHSQIASRSKTAHKIQGFTQISKNKKRPIVNYSKFSQQRDHDSERNHLPSPRPNPIRNRKYQGGKNIKIGRASRFFHDWHADIPGPGDYQIQSFFQRHAFKQA